MALAVKTYDAKIDSKKRITLRSALYEYYHAEEYDDGRIILEPRELAPPFQISEKSLAMVTLTPLLFTSSSPVKALSNVIR